MSFIQCFDNTGSESLAVFVNLNLAEAVYMDTTAGTELYSVKIKVGGVEYDMFDEPADRAKASNAILQVTGLKGK
jgi:hypothetical protein